MTWQDIFKIVTALIASIGAGGIIVFALASWLGKVWANRILNSEKHELRLELEKTKKELDVIKETTLRFQNDKILAYRAISDIVARVLASFDAYKMGRLTPQDAAMRFDEFNEQRIRVYAYMAMLAPQRVIDAQDRLMDKIMKVYRGAEPYDWKEIRELAIDLLNAIRVDIGIDKTPIEYRGEL